MFINITIFHIVRTYFFYTLCNIYVIYIYVIYIPLPVTHDERSHVVENVLNFNKMIYHVCVHERVYMIDIFRTFLFRGYRHHMLFPNNVNDIHPNRRGLGVLARKYIDIIHSRHFDLLNPS